MAACVPKNINKNTDLTDLIPESEIEKTINTIGIKEKRYADKNVCASDLCYEAAKKLFDDMNIDKDTIDVLIFMSQTPDYHIPATAPLLQHRLGLSSSTACFDVTLACSGYIYSLSTAFTYASQKGVRRVLLLDGETFSKIVSTKDKVNAPLYGDAGTATLIEKGSFGKSFFSLFSDGSGENALKIKAGGYRNPSSVDNLQEKECENSNIRSDHQIYMEGMDIFNFTMKVVPKSVKEILNYSGNNLDEIDYVVFHQANKFMTDFFAKKLKLPVEKVPYCLQKFGNTSSASIPLTIVSELCDVLNNSSPKILLSGFGGGLSWGTSLLEVSNCIISELVEV
ncbi:MAG: ketoacyl-ACP synthase III [bacterium]|nr:ketoacyl-ACP synthase III [bacterium]